MRLALPRSDQPADTFNGHRRNRRCGRKPHLSLLIWLLTAGSSLYCTQLQAQQAGTVEEVPEAEAAAVPNAALEELRSQLAGDEAALFATLSRAELELELAPLTLEAIEERATAALEQLATVATALSTTLIEDRQLEVSKGDQSTRTEVLERARLISQFKDELVIRTNILLEAARAKGADNTKAQRYVDVIDSLELPTATITKVSVQSAEQLARDSIRQVREEPPVHERAEPWTIPTSELRLELQPLRRAQLEERVEKWLQILQRQVRERIRIDIALGKINDQAQREVLARLASRQQEIISDTVERLQVALTVLAKRGGDTALASQYIANATGQSIDLTDPSVFYAQAKAWLFSSSGGLSVALDVLQFFAILIFFWIVSRFIGALIATALKNVPRASSLLQNFLVGGARRVVMLVGVLVAIAALGINITPLAAAIGAAGLVVGLALQGTLSNFASGILILIYRPFDVGDVINAGGVFGKVDDMNLVSTRILTFDNQVNVVPNNAVWGNVITNATALDTRRVDMTFGIAYGADMDKAQKIIESVVYAHPKVLETPAPNIRMHELGDSSVNFIVRPWAKTAEYWDVFWEISRTIKERFDAEGINIPFPQRDLHLSGPIEVVMAPGAGDATDKPDPT